MAHLYKLFSLNSGTTQASNRHSWEGIIRSSCSQVTARYKCSAGWDGCNKEDGQGLSSFLFWLAIQSGPCISALNSKIEEIKSPSHSIVSRDSKWVTCPFLLTSIALMLFGETIWAFEKLVRALRNQVLVWLKCQPCCSFAMLIRWPAEQQTHSRLITSDHCADTSNGLWSLAWGSRNEGRRVVQIDQNSRIRIVAL